VELRLSAADETPVAPALPAAVAPTAASNEAPAPTAPTAPAPDLARDTIESLNIRQRRLLTLLRDRGGITRVEYESFFHVGTRTAKRDLKGLLDAGLIEHRGSSTASYYVLGRG
jgi:predicted HTH transcriptional regulator